MKDANKAIWEALTDSAELLAMLGANVPFTDKEGDAATINSIYPAGLAPMTAKTPFITVQGGVITKEGKHTYASTHYLRVYDARNKSYFTINEIAEKIMELLDEQIFSLDSKVMVRAKYDSTLNEATDEAMALHFREVRFRIVLIS